MGIVGIRNIKDEIRILGFDDAPFTLYDKKTKIIGTVFRGGASLDGVLSDEINVDGLDSTEKITGIINGSSHKEQVRVIMLDGVTFGGFNVVDMEKLNNETGLPVISVVRDKPDFDSIKKALTKFKDGKERWKLIKKAGELNSIDVKNQKTGNIKKIWFQVRGIKSDYARKIIEMSSTRSFIPEPIRVAHLIGYGIRVNK